jgi:hypothetical protein
MLDLSWLIVYEKSVYFLEQHRILSCAMADGREDFNEPSRLMRYIFLR